MRRISIYLVLFIFMRTSIASFCYWNSGCPYKYFGSKTPYNFIRGDFRDSIVRLKGCQPVSIWGFYRHGKRYPSPKFANNMKSVLYVQEHVKQNYDAGMSSLCAQDVENLVQWKADMKLFENYGEMFEEGLLEMEEIGKRMKQAFSKLLINLKEGEYHFQVTTGNRMMESLEAFIKGFNNDNSTYQIAKSFEAPVTTCASYQKELKIENDAKLYAEPYNYFNNPEWLAMKDRIQRRTGLTNLTDDSLVAIYDICRYNTSGFDNVLSPWCALFTTEDLLVQEYVDDIKHYYRHGYGHNHTEVFGRIQLNDLLDRFKQSKEGNGPKISVFVSRTTMIDVVYKAINLFKDEEPLTAGYRDPNRKWRTSNKSTFASNLVAVLNRCPENNASEYNVVFYLNEEPLMSICKHGVCTWEEFEQKLTFENISLDFCDEPN